MAKKKRVPNMVPAAETVQWIGLCPCGCGAYKAVLVDENEKCIATFGWDLEGWVAFCAGVLRQIKGESIEGVVCDHHTAH